MSKVNFNSVGIKLAGLLYMPSNIPTGGAGAVVMAHGFSATKEMYLPPIATQLQAAGYVVLIFDYRCQGESDGEPRGKINWQEQVEDYKNAISYVSSLQEVNANKIGIFGSSYSGAHVIQVGAYDIRVKAVVSQVPGLDLYEIFRRFNTPESFQQLFMLFAMDRKKRYETGKGDVFPVISTDGKSVLPDLNSYKFFTEASKLSPGWVNFTTIESLEAAAEYNVTSIIHRVSPRPLLMLISANDSVVGTDIQVDAFEKAREPKKLVMLQNTNHFDFYFGETQKRVTEEMIAWFKTYLV